MGSDRAWAVEWSAWQPHERCWLGGRLPCAPGLYRIRRAGWNELDYIGQTGLTLSERQGMLRGVYAEEMPYRDPHTAGPALWALRHATGCVFEVAVSPFVGDYVSRLGREAIAIAQYRQVWGHSPTVQFGRMPAGYRISSSNNRKLVEAGKRLRGGLTDAVDTTHAPSLPPMGDLSGDPEGAGWCGHTWSEWAPASVTPRRVRRDALGLYRLRVPGQPGLVYIGEGAVSSRVSQHLRKVARPREPQGEVFSADMEASWTLNESWVKRQRLELENDLIAAYTLTKGSPPVGQFSAGGAGELR